MSYKDSANRALAFWAAMFFLAPSLAQMPSPEETEVKVVELAGNLYVLMGIGGNIALSTGPDGAFIVDDDVQPMAPKIQAAIADISKGPVKTVFNTHWHFDHTGGNDLFAADGALIVAHDNVHQRMSTAQLSSFSDTETPPSPATALPVITFANAATFHLNGQTIKAMHMPAAHTDGDAILLFEEANVAHLGDVYFNGLYPGVDINSGGSAAGLLEAVDRIIPMLNDQTRIIPGHGPIATLDDLKAYRSMLSLVTARIQLLIEEGKTREQVVALRPTVNFDAEWAWEFMPSDRWIELLYDSLVQVPRELAAD